jgi:AraC family transcriptional regulator
VAFPKSVLPRHYHERACLSVVLEGSFTEYLNGCAAVCDPGGVLLKPVGEPHRDEFAGSLQVIVEPDADAADRLGEPGALFDRVSHSRNAVAHAIARRVAHEIENPDPFATLAVEGLSFELLVAVLRAGRGPQPGSRPPQWLGRVRDQIATSDGVPLISRLAADAEVHPAYLARVFRRCYGVSIGRFAREARLERVARELVESPAPLSVIAFRAGFADQSHLTRAFRARWGVTPRQYRLATKHRDS